MILPLMTTKSCFKVIERGGTMIVYMANGRVAWRIGDTRIASLYDRGYYLAPQGWGILQRKEIVGDGWRPGILGELRKERIDG